MSSVFKLVDSEIADFASMSAAIFFALSHSRPSVKGTAMHTMASARNIVRVIAMFQIDRNASRSSGEDTDSDKFVGPAAIITAYTSLGSFRGTSSINVLRVMVWPTAIDIALETKSVSQSNICGRVKHTRRAARKIQQLLRN